MIATGNNKNIILKDSDFILTNRTCAIAITAGMSFRTALAADFSRVFLESKTRNRRCTALLPAASQIPGKYLFFLVTRATKMQHVGP